ncbi:MAG: hypothetical protein EAZ57_03180 [Cytophagales bacterium]|nr:MAG: hypothetical protein EAZ67_03645 [Cytophagales bacterium]TAF61466.1 MAG: hypothetical protein EAZ57_03180 [Cytophagales bacterium]
MWCYLLRYLGILGLLMGSCCAAFSQIEWAYGIVETSVAQKSNPDFGPSKVLGEPDVFPNPDLNPDAWKIDFVLREGTEEIKVMFAKAIQVLKIFVVENYGISPIEIQLFDEKDKLRERFTINENFDLSLMLESKVSYVLLYEKTPYKVKYIKLVVHEPWNGDNKCQLDGIGISEFDVNYPESNNQVYSVINPGIEPDKVSTPKDYALRGRIVDFKSDQGIANAEVIITNVANGQRSVTLTDKDGYYNFKVKEAQYALAAQKPNFVSLEKTLIATTGNYAANHIFEANLHLRPFDVANKIVVNDIQFDLNSHRILEASFPTLDNTIKTIQSYPTYYVYIGVHTDSRGEDIYNLKLTEQRAQSLYEYLVKKGISPTRISAKGFGETQLLNQCANGVLCSNKLHLINRRVEILLSSDPPQR